MGNKSIAVLAFLLFQLVTATLFLRPAELFEWLEAIPLYEGLIIGTLLLTATSLEPHFHWGAMARQPITLCAVGLLVAVVASHLTHMYLGGAKESGELFLKTLLYYALVITVVNTPSRLKLFAANVGLCTGLMVTLCLLDYWGVIEMEFIVHLQDLDGHDDEGNPIFFQRMRGSGIFQDPNDLAMVIVAGGCLCLSFLFDRSLGAWRWFWGAPLLVFLAAILETKSRGGLLAGAAAFMTLLSYRFGTRFATVMGVVAICAMPFLSGRSDMGDGSTSHERIMMWREGFDAIKSPDLLFGIGQGMYADLAGLVAHNSFVHAYVELGLFGGTLFFGCFFFAAMQLYRLGQLPEPVWHPELVRFRPYLAAVLAGWITSMFSLSRCYVVPTFLILGLVAAYLNLVWIHTASGRPLIRWNKWAAWQLISASATCFVALYVFTAVFS